LSGNGGSSGTSGALLRLVLPGLSEDAFEFVNLLLRKTAHVVAYSILGFLYLRGVRGERRGWQIRWSVVAVALAAAVAMLDEWHQSMTSTRTGHVSDVMLDTVAAIGAQVVARSMVSASRRPPATGSTSS
jgi:VanZ family protein